MCIRDRYAGRLGRVVDQDDDGDYLVSWGDNEGEDWIEKKNLEFMPDDTYWNPDDEDEYAKGTDGEVATLDPEFEEDDSDERAIAAMKVARDESGKFGFEYPEDGKYGYKAERGSGTGAMGTMQVNVTIHNRETDEIMNIKDMHYLELEKGEEQETLAMIWDENKDLIQKEDAGEDKDVEKA